MTHDEFTAWLDGYLDGKIAKKHIEKIREKSVTVQDGPVLKKA